jgi:hypothetical protein
MASNISLGWCKLLQIRTLIRPHCWYKIGNGNEASVWFDTWDVYCPLKNQVSSRNVTDAGYNLQEKVSDVVSNAEWKWPASWYTLFPVLNQKITVPILRNDQEDQLFWKSHDGILKDFSVRDMWHTVRDRRNEVNWFELVWSKYGIPRHVIRLWLIMRKRLKMHDRLYQWDVGNDVDLSTLRCPLCKVQPDTHDHLFSAKVWLNVLKVADFPSISPVWNDIMGWLIPSSKHDDAQSIVGRLIVAASSYFIWQERNNRIHSKGEKTVD